MNNLPRSEISSAEIQEDQYISLRAALQVIKRRFWIIILMAALFTGVAVGISLLQTPQYQSSITVLVGQKENTATPYSLGSDVQGLQQLTLTLAKAANSRPLAEAVIEQYDLKTSPQEFLQERLNVEPITDTQFIQIDYTDPDPKRARLVADTIGEVFSEQIAEVSSDTSAITATVWEPAVVPDQPVSPDPIRNGLLTLGLGLLAGLVLVYLLDYFDDSWRSPEEVEQVSGLPIYGVIPTFDSVKAKPSKNEKKEKSGLFGFRRKASPKSQKEEQVDSFSSSLVTVLAPYSVPAEAYRTLRTNLLYAQVDAPPKVIALTSPGSQEGKSTTCVNLGVVLAQAGKQTLILECDLRRPTIHKIFGLRNIKGLMNVILGEDSLKEITQEPVPGLRVASLGPMPPNPAEILSSERFRELIDTPPVEVVSDVAILSPQVDGILFTLDARNTQKGAVRRSVKSLETVGARIIGTVTNNFKVSKDAYASYDGYSYVEK
jgi:capsular exopolysaccharide synthesis family protein